MSGGRGALHRLGRGIAPWHAPAGADATGRPLRALGIVLGLALALALGILAGCSPPGRPVLRLVSRPERDSTRLALVAAPGVKVNARLAPALELAGAGVVRFRGAATPDSAYFAGAPFTVIPGRHRAVHGTLRASVCRADEQVCRSLTLEL